jgi:MFS transporter, PHS family, inorganic phosphate transporter
LSYYVQVHGVLVERDVVRATNGIGRVLAQLDLNGITEEEAPAYDLFSRWFPKQHGRDLFACTSAWFILNIHYYKEHALFQSKIYGPWFVPASHVNAF